MTEATATTRPRGTRWCGIGSWLAGIGLLLVAAGLAGAATGVLKPLAAFSSFGLGLLLCLPAVVVLVIGLLLSKGSGGGIAAGRAWGALLAAGLVVAISLLQYPAGERPPPIHDISTDLDDPPLFIAVVPLREADDAANPPGYAGADTARQQRAAFPDLHTLQLIGDPARIFASAETVARDMGWTIVAADAAAGRLEATATTAWFRFRDDVVVRVRPTVTGADVDVRSKSRVGRGDMGTNAARIREFLSRLQAALG